MMSYSETEKNISRPRVEPGGDVRTGLAMCEETKTHHNPVLFRSIPDDLHYDDQLPSRERNIHRIHLSHVSYTTFHQIQR